MSLKVAFVAEYASENENELQFISALVAALGNSGGSRKAELDLSPAGDTLAVSETVGSKEAIVDNSASAAVLNKLLNGELQSAHLYWQASAWCVERHLDGCADLLVTHADEELTHMKKMYQFMIDSEFPISFTALPAPTITAETVLELFQQILAHEGTVTDAVGAAVNDAQAAGDHSTFEFLQWFVMEQRGEMKLFRNIVDRIKLIGDGPLALYMIDQEVTNIGKTATDPVSPMAAPPPGA